MKGILFKPDMIKAVIEGRKTQTRRVIKPQSPADATEVFSWFAPEISEGKAPEGLWFEDKNGLKFLQKPRYQVGETVYIKEAWAIKSFSPNYAKENQLLRVYKTDFIQSWISVDFETWSKYSTQKYHSWQSPLFMPEHFARYFIQITDVRAERLQEITEEDAIAEGCKAEIMPGIELPSARRRYSYLWDSINKPPYDWASNPWVWIYIFKFTMGE